MPRVSSTGIAILVLAVPAAALAQTASRPHVRDVAAELACGPRATLADPATPIRITGSLEPKKGLFALGETVTVAGGTAQGVKPGQLYLVRRAISDRFTMPTSDRQHVISVHTVGWLRIDDAQTDAAAGSIMQACDGIEIGDYLVPYDLPAVPATGPAGQPDFSAPGHILLGDERRQTASAGALMVLDRGSDHGIKAGQRLTIYRETMGGRGPMSIIGEATAVVVGAESTMIRIDVSRDAVYVGDLVAVQR